ncbi:SDR family NAD(P)-dependent oxidoreductase [Kibdelosporangium phytohabitans]|uniref:Carrier domain-containing protein n=1 Tax=Kibdelosporangium phytohabitans TaxID=860235 RepID=A0A0N9HYG8_9PSEU|nr:SDR family NAD(P)-dependent oxidoreductase [Kibdelosporangium phytohabitans]ALG08377.1 hypothetical protein AOZ06_16990 [Kibdelosporangium phytohabitans]MBE1470575.1 polyketide synthase PksN [Kibdelosporangium phytohabitans]
MSPAIAVVGIGCRMPGARDYREFFTNLRNRVDSVREVPADRWDTAQLYDPNPGTPNRTISKWLGVLDNPYLFDHGFFGMSPREARLLDPAQRMLMEETYHCIEDAGITAAALGAARTDVYVGNMERDHMIELAGLGHEVQSHSVLGVYDCLMANRISQTFGLNGSSVAVDAACASALVAVHLGVQALNTGDADYVIAGGVNLNVHPWKYVGFSKARMLSPTGRCQTFDRDADGFVPGDGVGVVLLRRLDDAVRDGHHVYGVIRGSAVNHGRKRTTITAPTVASQREVVSAAIERAGVDPREITYVETHGTGTSLGDPIEVEALRQVFGPASDDVGWCALGSVKSNIGHLEGAAGIAGLIKVLLMMDSRRIVPNLHLRTLNPLIDLDDAPFRVAVDEAEWLPPAPGSLLRAGVSSFGFGGVNSHVVVEEFVAPERSESARPRPFLLSAASAPSLRRLLDRWRTESPAAPVADVTATLAAGRAQLPYRIAGVVRQPEDIASVIASAEVPDEAAELGPWALRVEPLPIPAGYDGDQCAYTTSVLKELLRLGVRPDLIVPVGSGVWPVLAAVDALDADVAARLAAGEPWAGELRVPSLPVAVPGTDRVVTPLPSSARYLAELSAVSAPEATQLDRLTALVDRLSEQRTFQSNLRVWKAAFEARGHTDWQEAPALAVAMAKQNALDRLNRKWDLPLSRFLTGERAVELLDLLVDGVLEPGDVLDLLAGSPVSAQLTGIDPGRYPLLRGLVGLPQDLASPSAWTSSGSGTVVPYPEIPLSGSLTETLVDLWQRGADVRWDLHPVAEGAKVRLPTTEFDRVEHRIPPPATWPAQPARVSQPDGTVLDLKTEWVATPRVAAPAAGGPVVVVGPDACQGAVRLGDVRFASPGDSVSEDAAGVVLVVPSADDPTDSAVAALDVAKAAYGRRIPIVAVGNHGPALVALAGLARCLRRETDTVGLRVVSVPGSFDDSATWDVVADELTRVDGGELVLHKDGSRVSQRFGTEPVAAEPVSSQIRPGGVYLITGGAGGLGKLLARHVLSVPDTRVALVGRSSDVDVRDLGDRAMYVPADISVTAEDAVSAARARFGPLTGVFHTAGVLRDGYVAHTTADDVREVLAPKALGALNLDRATRDEPLELFVLYSSVVAVVGNVGQSAYAMANAFLDEFANTRVGPGRTLSVGWPVWQDGGMTVSGRGVLGSDTGMQPMPAEVGLAALDRLLALGGARAFLYGNPDLLPDLLARDEPAAAPEPEEASPERALDWAREYVATTVAQLRGVSPDEIDLDTGLDRFGLDSIVISEFNARTEAAIGSVGETLLFECRTLAAAAERIAQLRPAELAARYGTTHVTPMTPDAPEVAPAAETAPVNENIGGVAIIGIAGRYPQAPDLDAFWRNLAGGRDCVTEVPQARWDHRAHAAEGGAYCGSGAFLDAVDEFDPLFFNISPREAELMDPQERLFLQTAWHAFEHAGYPPYRLGDNRDVGVFVGVTTQTYLLRQADAVVPPSPQWSIANRVSFWLDLRGPSMPVDTACAASLTAIHQAVRSLARGECRMALVGGVNLYLHPSKYDWLCQLQMLSRTGRCHTFGADADGFVPGEGVGAVVLKPLRDALADGDRVLGVVKGTAINHGGRTNGFTVPNPRAQAELIRAALDDAGVDPGTIGYVEAHGTGTALGDPVEIAGLAQAYAGVSPGTCAIGSVKTNIGHLESASGMAGLTKVLLQFEHSRLVPSLHSDETNPRIDFAATPFTVQHELADWPGTQPRRAGISSFGAGGANAHVVVEEAPAATARRGPENGEHLVIVSAADQERLREHCANLAAAIRGGELRVAEVAYQLQVRREPLAERVAMLVSDRGTLVERLLAFAAGEWTSTKDKAARAELEDALARRDWEAIGAAWVAGADVPWESLHDTPLRTVELPRYPFAAERYWLPEPKPDTVTLTGQEPILADHRVGGVPILPAVGAIELVRAAVGQAPIRLRNNVWTAPIMVPEPTPLRIVLEDGRYEVRGKDGTYVTGSVEPVTGEEERLDLDAIRARCEGSVTSGEFYPDVRARGLDLGPTYQGITRLHWADEEAFAELAAPPGGDRHTLHPGMFDSALQGCLWLLGRKFDRVHLPYSIGAVEILGPTPARGFSHVVLRKVTAEGSKVDVRLTDEQGRVVLRVLDLWVRPWQAPGERVSHFRPKWVGEVIGERRDPGAVRVLASTEQARQKISAGFERIVDEDADTVVFAVADAIGETSEQIDAALLPLLRLTQDLVRAKDKRPVRLVVGVPAGVPAYRALGGFLRTVSLESSRISSVLVELVGSEPLSRLVDEACGTASGAEVRYEDGQRCVLRWEKHTPARRTVLRDGGVYLITGGAGGLGSLVARWLEDTVGARVVRAGRSEANDIRADVSTLAGARAAISFAEEKFGALNGIFHCAGVLRDGYLVRQTEDQVREVVAGKALGAVNLAAAAEGRDLDFLCLFSSLAAAVGSAGQSGYAYANSFLDAFAASRSAYTVSVNWPLWMDGGMGVDAGVAEWLEVNLGLRPLTTEAGLTALDAVLGGPERQVVVVPGDGAAVGKRLGIGTPPRPVQRTAVTGPREFLIAEIAAIAKLDPARIRPDRPIGDYGFDSLSFGVLANRLVSELDVDVTPALFFEYTTVAEVAGHLAATYPAKFGTGTAPEPQTTSKPVEPARVRNGPEPVAIIGMHGMLPGSSDLAEFWRNLDAGRDLVTEIPPDRWDWREVYHTTPGPNRTNSKWGGFVPDVDKFDARFFGISPKEAELMDPQQRLFLQTAYRAVEEAGYRPSDLAKGTTGLFVGVASHDYYDLMREAGVPVEAFTTTGLFHAVLANRVSYLMNLTGPSFPIDTACSSSLVALRTAVESLQAGSCDTAIVGGVNLLLSPMVYISFARAGMLSPTGRCRTFDANADGYVRAEGVGALLLKPLSAAERDGDHVHAVIRGSAVNHGGKVTTLTTPNPNAQADLMVKAFGEVDPATVGYMELHGTGTALGDPIEINGVKRAFGELRDRAGLPRLTERTTLIGSVKSNIGHPESAAGIAGIFKVILAMKHGRVPGNLHLSELNPQIRLDGSPLSIVDGSTAWPRPRDEDGGELPRRAGVSSFGFGGVNAHVLLEEHVPAPAPQQPGEQVFVLSARSADRLREYAAALAEAVRPTAGTDPSKVAAAVAEVAGVPADQLPLDEPLVDLGLSSHALSVLADTGMGTDDLAGRTIEQLAGSRVDGPAAAGELADIAYTLRVGREPMNHRLAVVTDSAATLADALATFAATGTPGERTWLGTATGPAAPDPGGLGASDAQAAGGALTDLAGHWVTGADVDWSAVRTGRRPRRVSLPTYPFAKDRHWFSAPQDERDKDYRVHLSGDETLVAEHKVNRQAVVAGVMQLDLAISAAEARGGDATSVSRVSWTSPLVVPPGGVDVFVDLTERDGGIDYQVRTAGGTHSAGRFARATTSSARVDLEAVRQRCPDSHDHDAIYQAFDGMGISYGPTYRGLREAWTGDGELLARYETGNAVAAMDAGLQAISVLEGAEPGRSRMPFSVESVDRLAAVPLSGHVHVRASSSGHDVTLLDEQGRPCLVLREVIVRAEQDPLDGFFFRPFWAEQDERAERPRGGNLVVGRRLDGLHGPVWHVELGGRDRRLGDDEWEIDAGAPEPGLRDCLREFTGFRHVWFHADSAPVLFHLVRALAETGALNRVESIRSVVSGTHDAGGRQVANPAAAAVVGLTKSLAREYPRIGVSCVDITSPPGDRLFTEPARQDNREVAIVGGRRLVRRLRSLRLPPPVRPPFRDGGGYLIVGGAGGIGLALAEHLAATVSARLVLVGRRPADGRIEAALDRLAELGGQASYQRADVTDHDAMRSVVAKATAHGPLHGVIHAAMELRDGIVERMSDEDFDAVLAPKADGTRVLGEALVGERLDFLLVLSSVQSFTAAGGQANYAAASAAQDAFAHRIATSCRFPVHIVNFGPWAEVGRVAGHGDSLAARGYQPIEPAAGIRAIERILASDERQVVALHADRAVLDSIGVVPSEPVPVADRVPAFDGDPAEQEALDSFVTDALWFAFDRLGLFTSPGEKHSREALPDRLGVAPAHRRLVDALVQVLVDRGVLVAVDGRVGASDFVTRPVKPDPEPLRSRFPNLAARLELVTRSLAALPDVLRGHRLATEVLFPDGSMDLVSPIYRGEALVDYCNALVADQVAGSRPARVLEVGAGTGGTTEAVLAELAARGVRASYEATDISAGLLARTRARLDSRGLPVKFSKLDIESPSDTATGYDVVVAANVLHATDDLDDVLARLRRMLNPGGRLVLTEVTAVQPFHTVTFGLLDGWWRYSDPDRRLPGSPLLDVHLWRQCLAHAGFSEVQVLGHPATPGVLPQRVVVAEVPSDDDSKPVEPAGDTRDVQAVVAERVAACLGVPVAEVGADTPMADLGVDSIVAVELTNQLNDELGISLKTAIVFDHPTVVDLARFITTSHGDHLAVAAEPERPRPAATGLRAVRFDRPGHPRDLRIVPIDPVEPGHGEVEIQVRAFPVNFSDFLVAKGLYPMMPDFPVTPGVEVSGVVRRVGEGVHRFKPGDEVIGLTRLDMGGQATVVCTDEDFVVAKPGNVSHEEACGFPVAFLAMYLAFERADVRPGDRILIPAATGTNGLIAVQLARLAGAEIIATAGARHKIDHLAELGIDNTIDHEREDVVAEVLRRTGGTGVDVVINTLGGTTQQGLNVLAPDGRYVEIAVAGLRTGRALDLSRLVDNQTFYSFNTKKFFLRHPRQRAEYLRIAAEHLGSGRVRPSVAHVLPFDRVTEAYARKEDRAVIGRVVVTVPDPSDTP